MVQIAKLDNFGILAVTGRDAHKFLQGYVTCDMDDVSDTVSAIGAICNLQGRMVTSFRILQSDEGYLLRMARQLVPVTMEFLKKYIVFSKAEMRDCSDELSCLGITGEIEESPLEVGEVTRTNDGYRVRVGEADRFEAWSRDPNLLIADAGTMTDGEWRAWEISVGIAWVTGATSEEFIPQMFAYDRIGGVAFDKGCYLGQEIVARMQYRGALSRHLYRGKANKPVEISDPLQDDTGKTVGQVVAAEGETFLAVVQVKNDHVPDVPGCSLEAIA